LAFELDVRFYDARLAWLLLYRNWAI